MVVDCDQVLLNTPSSRPAFVARGHREWRQARAGEGRRAVCLGDHASLSVIGRNGSEPRHCQWSVPSSATKQKRAPMRPWVMPTSTPMMHPDSPTRRDCW